MNWLKFFGMRSGYANPRRQRSALLRLECLEDRVVPATADLIAHRPVTDYFNSAATVVPAANEESYTLGPGIRINGDDDNANGTPDYLDSGPLTSADNDLVQVDISAGTLTFTDNLHVWTTQTKGQAIGNGTLLSSGTVWVEYASLTHTTDNTSAVMTLTATDDSGTATDKLVFHSFQSVVIAIGGNSQNPANVGDPNLGVFTIAANLYKSGYDVHMYWHSDVSSTGAGPAFNEVASAVKYRNVDYVAIFGYSWGGGATYELARGLQNDASLSGQYTLSYTAYIDAITHYSITSERRLPPGTQYHDNIYQRRDWLLRGNSVTGAVNLNVTNTSWGKNLVHTTIDDNGTVQNTIFNDLSSHVTR